jgi:hypothetical protein
MHMHAIESGFVFSYYHACMVVVGIEVKKISRVYESVPPGPPGQLVLLLVLAFQS